MYLVIVCVKGLDYFLGDVVKLRKFICFKR